MTAFETRLCNLISTSQGLNQLFRLYGRSKDKNDLSNCKMLGRRIRICYSKLKEDWAELEAVADLTEIEK